MFSQLLYLLNISIAFSQISTCRFSPNMFNGQVLVPGPLKREQRCRDKIAADYEGRVPWPPAASLFDFVRCAIAFDDPYAMAVMAAYLEAEFEVVRVKNRFEDDEIEEVSAEKLQAEFYSAETIGEDIVLNDIVLSEGAPKSENMYRDVLLNLRPKGSDFICEVQLTLTGISILKKSEQKIYTIARMASAEELLETFVFSNAEGIPDSIGGPVEVLHRIEEFLLDIDFADLELHGSISPERPLFSIVGNQRYTAEEEELEPLSPQSARA